MQRSGFFFKTAIAVISALLFGSAVCIVINVSIILYTKQFIFSDAGQLPRAQVIMVLGAQVFSTGHMSPILQDRSLKGFNLYTMQKAPKVLLSGDHGTPYYDEVGSMKRFFLKMHVDPDDIFLDHAGFNTYSSIVRAKKIFQIRDIIIVTQRFHLPRALFIARSIGMNANGFIADRREYSESTYYAFREFFANIKAFVEVLVSRKPRFLGKTIPITGDGRLSWD